MLSIAFSTSVSAETITTPQSLFVEQNIVVKSGSVNIVSSNYTFTTNDGNMEKGSIKSQEIAYVPNQYATSNHSYIISGEADSTGNFPVLVPKGSKVNFKLDRIPYAIQHMTSATSTSYDTIPENVRILLYYTDGSMEYVDDVTLTNKSGNRYVSDITCSFLPLKNVWQFEIIITNKIPLGTTTIYVGESDGTHEGWYLTIDQETKTEGLLSSIIEWVKKIVTGITELPQKLWTLISDGLKSLFVPSEDFILQFKDDMDSMLEQKLGAVYQVVNIMTESWDRITANDVANTINIPSTSISLPENTDFVFGGYDVQIVPNGFDWLANMIKTVVGIICTVLCINGLRKKYDEVMGVEQ